jgi:hypothetical protein
MYECPLTGVKGWILEVRQTSGLSSLSIKNEKHSVPHLIVPYKDYLREHMEIFPVLKVLLVQTGSPTEDRKTKNKNLI